VQVCVLQCDKCKIHKDESCVNNEELDDNSAVSAPRIKFQQVAYLVDVKGRHDNFLDAKANDLNPLHNFVRH
jgi:hypothetical protein